MKLIDLIVLLDADETIHIIRGIKSKYIGKATAAIDEVNDNDLCSKIKNIYTGFGGICVDIW